MGGGWRLFFLGFFCNAFAVALLLGCCPRAARTRFRVLLRSTSIHVYSRGVPTACLPRHVCLQSYSDKQPSPLLASWGPHRLAGGGLGHCQYAVQHTWKHQAKRGGTACAEQSLARSDLTPGCCSGPMSHVRPVSKYDRTVCGRRCAQVSTPAMNETQRRNGAP